MISRGITSLCSAFLTYYYCHQLDHLIKYQYFLFFRQQYIPFVGCHIPTHASRAWIFAFGSFVERPLEGGGAALWRTHRKFGRHFVLRFSRSSGLPLWGQGENFVRVSYTRNISFSSLHWSFLCILCSFLPTGVYSDNTYSFYIHAPTCRIQIRPVLVRTYPNSKTWWNHLENIVKYPTTCPTKLSCTSWAKQDLKAS